MNRYSTETENYVPALWREADVVDVAPVDTAPLTVTTNAALGLATRTMPRGDDDAFTQARATLLVSTAYGAAALLIVAGLLSLAWLYRALGGDGAVYAYVGLVVWGTCVLLALLGNRRQSLHHSQSGVMHHELEVKRDVAKYAIRTHAELLMRQMEARDHDRK